MSTRHGNAYITHDIIKVLPAEVLRYFYTKKPTKQRNFDLENIYRLVNEYDSVERVYYGIEEILRGIILRNKRIPIKLSI